jgi:hypothetical protein
MRVFTLPIMDIFYGYPLGMGKLSSLLSDLEPLGLESLSLCLSIDLISVSLNQFSAFLSPNPTTTSSSRLRTQIRKKNLGFAVMKNNNFEIKKEIRSFDFGGRFGFVIDVVRNVLVEDFDFLQF